MAAMDDVRSQMLGDIVFMTICCLLMMVLFVSLVHDLLCGMKKKIRKIERYLSLIFVTLCVLAGLFDLIHAIMSYQRRLTMLDASDDEINGIRAGADICSFGAIHSFYILLIHRLNITFKHTVYQISAVFHISIWILIIASCISTSIYVFIIMNASSLATYATVLFPVECVFMAIDSSINIALFVLFLSKLRDLIIDIHYNETPPTSLSIKHKMTTIEEMECEFDSKQISFIRFMTKYALLNGIAIIYCQLNYCFIIYFLLTDLRWQFGQNIIYCARTFLMTLYVLITFLNFSFNRKYYLDFHFSF